jgi:gliding motility-associatede transport system auxiliary component
MDLLKRFSAPAGAVILLCCLATNLLAPERSVLVSVLLGVGLLLMLLGGLFNYSVILDRLKGRAVREGGGDLAYILIVAVVLGLLNFLAVRHHKRFDLSAQGSFTLSQQTRKILAALPREVQVRAYYYTGTLAEQKMRDLLEEYAYQAPQKFHVQFVDPLKNPAQAKKDSVTQEQSVVLQSGGQSSTVVSGDEETITNAVLKVTRDTKKTLCFAIGHGEKDLKDTGPQGLSSFQAAAAKQQTETESFSPAMGVPAHCAAVVVAGPRKPWLPAELDKLQAYLDKGGKAAILLDPGEDSGMEPLLARYGITLSHDEVIDRVSALFGGKPDIPMVPGDGYESHPITKGFDYQTFYPLATSLNLASPPPAGVSLQALARTTPLSWGEMNYEKEAATGKLRLDPEDKPGPLVLAAVATRTAEGAAAAPASPALEGKKPSKPETRLVVFGDSDFPCNAYFSATSNGELFLNVANWLAGQEDLVAIPPKSRLPSLVTLSQQQAHLIWIFSLLVAPAGILVVGTGIWFRRRKL